MNHFETAEHYFELNQKHSTEFMKTRFYNTLQLAVYDVSFSLLQFLSHKPKIAIIRQGSSVFESMIPIFLRQQTPIQFKNINQNTNQYLTEIDKETNFVLWSSENEITGEIIFSDAQCAEIHKNLSDKRIFSIQIANASRSLNKIEILKNNYAVVIESEGLFGSSQAQIFFTEKLKAPTLIGPFQKNNFSTNQKVTKNYDIQILSQHLYEKLFGPTVKYLNDRQCFVFKKCSGEMILQMLIEKKSVSAGQIFSASALPTWTLDTFKNWWPESEKPDLLLGFLAIDISAFVANPQLESEISEIYQKIQTETSWSVG